MRILFLSFLLLFGLFEMGYAGNPSSRTILGVIDGTCARALWKIMRPINPWAKLKSEIANEFDQYGHKISAIGRTPSDLDDDVYRKGLANLGLALDRGTPLAQHSAVVTGIVIMTSGRNVRIEYHSYVGGLNVVISAHTPVEEIIPKINIALLDYEIIRKAHMYGGTYFWFAKGSDVDDERLASFLEKTFLKALDDDKDATRIADFPDHLNLKIIDEKIFDTDFRSAVYNGSDIVVSVDAPAESLFHRLSNALLEEQVTDWMWRHYDYRKRANGSVVINNGVDDVAYEGGLKRILELFNNPSLVRDAKPIFVRLGHIYVTENQLEIKLRQVSNSETVFDIYVPSDGTKMNAGTFTKFLPPAPQL